MYGVYDVLSLAGLLSCQAMAKSPISTLHGMVEAQKAVAVEARG